MEEPPTVFVPKLDGSVRVCMDFQKLNSVFTFNAYPMPRVDTLLEARWWWWGSVIHDIFEHELSANLYGP